MLTQLSIPPCSWGSHFGGKMPSPVLTVRLGSASDDQAHPRTGSGGPRLSGVLQDHTRAGPCVTLSQWPLL